MDRDTAFEVLDGVMLSDGSICRPSLNAYFHMTLSGGRHLDWLLYIRRALRTFDIPVGSEFPKAFPAIGYGGKPRTFCELRSRVSQFLTLQYERWYFTGKKEVPEDFVFTPAVLANEMMGDGSSNWYNGNPSIGVCAHLSTQSFNLHSIEILEYELRQLGLLHLSRTHHPAQGGSGIGIRILGGSAADLMELIEPHVMPSYRYKIKKPGQNARSNSLATITL